MMPARACFEYRDIPANMQAEAEAWREKMVEKAAEATRRCLHPRQKKERLGRIPQMHANERREITEVHAGDIAAAG